MKERISRIENNVQDKNSVAWKKLCEYVDLVVENGSDEFIPREYLGDDLFQQIYTLPKSISKLKSVTKIDLYGSQLKRIPPEIGEMENLEYFDPYTSYNLHWFPYEITRCNKLKNSRVSTRALYGNFKYRKGFPRLDHNPVKFDDEIIKCSVCHNEIKHEEIEQYWISLRVGTDTLPLLVNTCSNECKERLPKPSKQYVQEPHKGGVNLKQPPTWNEFHEEQNIIKTQDNEMNVEKKTHKKINFSDIKPLKLIKRIWNR